MAALPAAIGKEAQTKYILSPVSHLFSLNFLFKAYGKVMTKCEKIRGGGTRA
jgi:hypothetical protein